MLATIRNQAQNKNVLRHGYIVRTGHTYTRDPLVPDFPSGGIDIKLLFCRSVDRRMDNSRKHAWIICIHVELKLL
jgi:hypothetical protein